MIIWFALIIPLIFATVLYGVKKFRNKIVWWEVPVLFLVSAIMIFGAKLLTETFQISDTERIVDYVKYVEHHEYWNEWVEEECEDCDSDGNCTTYDCSSRERHKPYTVIVTALGEEYEFEEGYSTSGILTAEPGGEAPKIYKSLIQQFGVNPKIIHSYASRLDKDYGPGYRGHVYRAYWNGSPETAEPVEWVQTYENRTQASTSEFRFDPVDPADFTKNALFEYPKIESEYVGKSILGYDNSELDKYARQRNAVIATKKELKVYFLVYRNKPEEAFLMQERLWGGGNKNEAVICIGISEENDIQWSGVFSWSKEESFKKEIQGYIENYDRLDQKSFRSIIDYSYDNLEANFIRREFEEFSYITVEPPTWAIILTFLVILGAGFGMMVWVVKNKYDRDFPKEYELNLISQELLTMVSVSSQFSDSFDKSLAVDGETDTAWHNSTNHPAPCEAIIGIRQAHLVNGLSYVPIQGVDYGRIKDYRIEISEFGESWEKVKEGQFKNVGLPQTTTFPHRYPVRLVKLVAMSTHDADNLVSISEVNLFYSKGSPKN